uniref:Uncharacterized protein n=1 Tax=Monopterus albus TaxID=43700 RepID=A0A3Q3JI22_MONAL
MHQQPYLVCIRRPGNFARKLPLPPPHRDLTSMCWGFEKVVANTGTDFDKVAMETRYDDGNMWLKWVQYTAVSTNNIDCVACAKARPTLGTAPFKLNNQNDPEGLRCTVKLFGSATVPIEEKCRTLYFLLPPVQRPDIPPSVVVASCLSWRKESL